MVSRPSRTCPHSSPTPSARSRPRRWREGGMGGGRACLGLEPHVQAASLLSCPKLIDQDHWNRLPCLLIRCGCLPTSCTHKCIHDSFDRSRSTNVSRWLELPHKVHGLLTAE